jgi:hypothetical protein
MRLLLILFAAYLTGLALVPCQDDTDCIATEVHAGDAEHEEQHNEDFCTPFCICACCGVTRSAPPAAALVAIAPAAPPSVHVQPAFVPRWTATLYTKRDAQPPRA